jgi:hypothetical protein
MLKKNIFLIGFLLFASILCNKSLANDAIIFLENNPKNMMVGESYSFYVTVDAKTNIDNLEVQFWVRDGSIELTDVGIAKDYYITKDKDYYIDRIPSTPRKSTGFLTTSAAICGWGKLLKNQKAKCAFYFDASTYSISKIPFRIIAIDKNNNKPLASYTAFYQIKGGAFISRYMNYKLYKANQICQSLSKENKDNGKWTDCHTKNFTLSPDSFYIKNKNWHCHKNHIKNKKYD